MLVRSLLQILSLNYKSKRHYLIINSETETLKDTIKGPAGIESIRLKDFSHRQKSFEVTE